MASNDWMARNKALILQRLRECARVLEPSNADVATLELVSLIDAMSESVRLDPADDRVWLLFTAMAGAYPTARQLQALRRALGLAPPDTAGPLLLAHTRNASASAGDWQRPLRIVESAVVVDVNFCAKFVHNTGIQRVVREMMPHLVAIGGDRVQLVAWTRRSGVTRSLSAIERQRVVDWRAFASGISELEPARPDELIVPWRSRLLIPEVPEPTLMERLSALAQFSGNKVSIVGHDLIPIGSADLVLPTESERSAHFLSVIKYADQIVTVSKSVAGEFNSIVGALGSQGLPGPGVAAVPLAADVPPHAHSSVQAADETPLVLSVGSHEPRKNQNAVLFAVETLLGEGLDFRTIFVGGGSRRTTLAFDRHILALRKKRGWKIEARRGMKDSELWQTYSESRFTVFPSLHEGYGLPAVESLALGKPVLTANYGSLAEIAADGGCLTVDPRNDDDIVAALRSLLTDDALIERLAGEARARKPRGWHDYATELWAAARLGEPVGDPA